MFCFFGHEACKDLNSLTRDLTHTPCVRRQSVFKMFIIYFWLHWVFVAMHGLSWVSVSGGCSSLPQVDFSVLQSTACRHVGSVFATQGLIALRHVGSSWTRDWIHVPCILGQILNHWTTREVPLPNCLIINSQVLRFPCSLGGHPRWH